MTALNVLIIGCGSIGERHVRCFVQTKRGVVTACDNNPSLLQRIATTYGVRTADGWQAALASREFHAAVICTPAPLHVPITTAALKAGLHVLIEKPLSHDLAGVEDLFHARDASGRQAAVAYVFHVFPFLMQAREFIARGEFGPVLQATVTGGQPFHLLRPAYANTYYARHETGGGAIQDALTHSVNWMESVLGPTESLTCDRAHLTLPGVTVEDTVHITARHVGGALTSYALNQFQHPNENTFQLNSAKGSVKIEIHQKRWGYFRSGDTAWTWHEARVPDHDANFIAQANAFFDQIEGQPARLCSLEAAAQTLRFNLAALTSAKTGARVSCR